MEHLTLENNFNLYKFVLFSLYVTASFKASSFIVVITIYLPFKHVAHGDFVVSVDSVRKDE